MTQASPQARLTLSDAFQRFEATVSLDDRRLFQNTTLEDVRNEALDIEKQLRARRTFKNMARLQPFLRGMEHYAKVVEVLCNGTQYLPWIWAPVKLMLVLSVDYLDAFEKLIDAYGRIADTLPRFDRLASALSHDHNFQTLLALVYADILEFHRRAYKFVRRQSWKVFFASMWSGFESRFGAILRNLAYHSELVDKEAVSVDIADAVTRSRLDEERWENLEREWRAQKIRTVLSWLSTNDTPPEDVLERHVRDCIPGSCDWFLDHKKTRSWLHDGAPHALLWLYGKPGAGKSIICSSVVRHAADSGVNVLYHFCSYLGHTAADSSRLLRSIATQIVQKHQDLGIHVYDNYCQYYSVPTQKALRDLLPELLQGLGSVRIVVDGIDEWAIAEQTEALRNLTQLASTDSSSYICKILIASRDTLEISRMLRKKGSRATSVSLSDEEESLGINNSIASLIENKLANLPEHFSDLDLDSATLDKVKQALLTKSNGMFLWVRLVLDSLNTVYYPGELGSIIDDLPSDLDALYRRILEQLCSTPGAEKYGGVLAILGWICFARRPLHKVEILHGLAMRPAEGSAPLGVPIPQLLDHCKPLIEERPDSTIVFVHFSIPEFLLKSNAERISRELSQLNISYACATALVKGLSLLDPRITLSEYFTSIASGTHRLLPYSLKFWVEHCLDYAKCGGILEMNSPLPRLFTELQRKHDQLLQETIERDPGHNRSVGDVEGKDFEDGLNLLHHLPVYPLLHDVLIVQWKTSQHPCENGEDAEAFASQHDQTLFSNLAVYFESSVLYLLSQSAVDGIPQTTLENFKKSYSSTAFRCRFPSCLQASTGFASQEQRIAHEVTHFYRIKCKVETCQWSRIGFKNKASLDAHNRKYHELRSTSLIPPRVRRPAEGRDSTEHTTAGEERSHLTEAFPPPHPRRGGPGPRTGYFSEDETQAFNSAQTKQSYMNQLQGIGPTGGLTDTAHQRQVQGSREAQNVPTLAQQGELEDLTPERIKKSPLFKAHRGEDGAENLREERRQMQLQKTQSGHHALQDYQMQLMLVEQQKQKRLLMAEREEDLPEDLREEWRQMQLQKTQSRSHALEDYQMQLRLLEQQKQKRLLMAEREEDLPEDLREEWRQMQLQKTQSGHHALQDYQMQLMLLEQQKKKLLLTAEREEDLPEDLREEWRQMQLQKTQSRNHALEDFQMQLRLLKQQEQKRLLMAEREEDLPEDLREE